MKIDKDLRLVIPFDSANGESFVHAQAISRQVFERYYEVIARAFTKIYAGGYGIVSGPRVAAMLIKDVARDMGASDDVQAGLINEIRRLANVALLTPKGWEHVPLEEALAKKLIDEDEASEVENALAFFTLVSSMHKRSTREKDLAGAAALWGGRLTSLNFTEFVASLPTSTATDNSGATAAASSVPC